MSLLALATGALSLVAGMPAPAPAHAGAPVAGCAYLVTTGCGPRVLA
jgi:hypothetical protein